MRGALLSLVLVLGGAGALASFAPDEAPAELRPALERAAEAIRAAACDVERRFGEGDPDANAASCEAAEPVAEATVGRTSARLRNPANAPPAWARAYVERTDGGKAAETPALAYDLGDRVGLLRPIEVRRRCLRCHAGRDELAEGTRAWLERAYPRDRAVGYSLGDLRGFWWAEVPKRPPAAPGAKPSRGGPAPRPRDAGRVGRLRRFHPPQGGTRPHLADAEGSVDRRHRRGRPPPTWGRGGRGGGAVIR